ncbi:putative pentatricopeptide repeat-containing protein at1g12700 mitochondrial [Phtheirospermum japonicum]|uniref:Putative pentatricopeptide repeat-containing protein at1g12700 mitochondrial n=1 Tax=Phtheirospermum japonicum TaxID=374723 RepID=A0A830CIB8_9LAMI|nr:putative pentatricopeptide repeat-containing protein at1g12700 mitochondrial [Phtheirospermum japonicum]
MMRMQPHPSVIEFTKLLNITVKMKHYLAALNMFDEMRQWSAPVNEYTMNIAIHCYCLLNRADLGFSLLGCFFKLGYEPDLKTFSTLIKGLVLDDKVAQAEKMFKKLLCLNLCEPDGVMILTMVNGLCRARQTLAARDLLELLEESRCKPNGYAYCAVIDGLREDKMINDALELVFKMIDKGFSPTVATCTSIVQELCDAGRWQDVKDILNEMSDHKIPLNVITFNAMMDACCKKGKVKEAEYAVEIMIRLNVCPDIAMYDGLIHGYSLLGQMDKAKEIFDSIAKNGFKHTVFSYGGLINGKGLEHTTVIYNTMMHGLLRVGRFDDARNLFRDMENRKIDPSLRTFNILLDGLCRARRIDEAFSFVRVMEEKGVSPNVITYGTLIDGLCKNGRVEIARNVLNLLPSKEGFVEEAKSLVMEMEKSGCAPDAVTYTVIVQGLLKMNDLDKAIPFLEEMSKRGFSVSSTKLSMLLDKPKGLDENDDFFASDQVD